MSDKVENRNRAVLEAAVRMAGLSGYRNFTREQVAREAGVAVGSVNNAFGTMDALRDAVMATAVDRCLGPIVLQGIADRHPAALSAPQDVKDAALAA